MDCLIGYTGFVGSNLLLKHSFDRLYNSANIEESFGISPNLLVYAGIPAEKFLANSASEKDLATIKNAINNISLINPEEIVLISTVDVYDKPVSVNEDTIVEIEKLSPYGKNRELLEKWIEENFKKHLILRLPGLYGKNIKKNFIYDFIHRIPSRLSVKKFTELSANNHIIENFYTNEENGFYKCKDLMHHEMVLLKSIFNKLNFSALNFTDSRAIFQFYNLGWLWGHIETARMRGIKKLNLATEPCRVNELYQFLTGESFINELSATVPYYDFKTQYFSFFNGENGYIKDKNCVMNDIRQFIHSCHGQEL